MENLESAHRISITIRLEMAKLCKFMGSNPWVTVSNPAYSDCQNPSISVVITLFNYAEHISQCLDSVCASEISQLPEIFEILVVDDSSTDNSISLVEEYISKCALPICLVKKLFNTGLSDSRNVGVELARSPYVFILDADNWIYPRCLSVLYDAIKNSSYAAVYGIVNKFNDIDGQGFGLLSYYEWDVNELLRDPYIDAMAMFQRNILLKLGGYSTELMFGWEDYDLWLKIAQANYDCKLVPQILSSYRVHPYSMINTTNRYVPNIARYLKKKFSSLLKKYETQERAFGVTWDVILQQPQSELQQVKTELERTQFQLHQANVELHRVNTELHHTNTQLHHNNIELQQSQSKIERAENRIKAMESSKFWKLRSRWFRLKRVTGLPVNE